MPSQTYEGFKLSNKIILISALTFLFFSELFFFRNVLFSHLLFGDNGDGRLTMLLTEHWFHFFQGQEKFTELAMFFPDKNAIGYTDLLFGYGILHSLLRFFGADIFTAFKWTLISVHIFGTYTMFYLCYRKLNISLIWSLFATIAFSFSNAYSLHFGHTQLCGISFLPCIFIFLFNFFRNVTNFKNYNKWAYLFLTSFILLMYNSWYIAYFSVLFTFLFICSYLVLFRINGFELKEFEVYVKRTLKSIVCYILFSLVLLIPFFYVYLPTMKQSGGYSYNGMKAWVPVLSDFLNVGANNFMMGTMLSKIGLLDPTYYGERSQGYSIVLLLLFFTTFFFILQKAKVLKRENLARRQFLIIESVFISVVACFILIVRVLPSDSSLWYFVHLIIPGASSIRAVARFMLWLSFPMSIISAYAADKYLFVNSKFKNIFSVFLVILLWVSNINIDGANANFDIDKEKKFVFSVQSPPQDAEIMFIVDNKAQKYDAYVQLDAFEIADFYQLKTINGYSGQIPENWGLEDKYSYDIAVDKWVTMHNLKNVYAYDKEKNIWISYENYIERFKTYHLGDEILFKPGGNAGFYTTRGFWLNNLSSAYNAEMAIYVQDEIKSDIVLKLTALPFLKDSEKQQKVKVFVNDTFIEEWLIDKEDTYEAIIPQKLLISKWLNLRFEILNPIDPKDIGLFIKNIQFGIVFKKLSIAKTKESK